MKKVFIFALAAMTFVACNKETSPEPEKEISKELTPGAACFMNAAAFNGIFSEVSNGMARVASAGKQNLPAYFATESIEYPIVEWTPKDGTWPIDVTLNYGENPVVAQDGLEHAGVMELHATGLFETAGSVFTPTFKDFYTYGTIVSGLQTITNKGANEAGNLVYEVVVEGGRMGKKPVFVYDEKSLREEITPGQFSITGTMKSVSQVDTVPGFEASANEKPMVIAFGDLYPTDGVVHVKFDKPLEYFIGDQFSEAALQSLTVKVSELDITFLGKQTDGTYNAQVDMDVNVLTMAYHMKATFSLNKDGIIPESVKYDKPTQK